MHEALFSLFLKLTYLLMETGSMDQRHSSHPSHMYKTDRERMQNHQQHDHQLNLGNSSMFPVENTGTNGVNLVTHFNPHLGPYNHQSGNFHCQVPANVPANAETSYDEYTHFPYGGIISQHPQHTMQHGFLHNQYAMGDIRRNANPVIQMEYERAPYKRKDPANFMFPQRENRNKYYHAGSSSNATTSTEISQAKPTYDSQRWPCDPASFIHSCSSHDSSNSRNASQRNVRSRYDTTIHLENISSGIRSSTNLSHQVQSITITPNANMGGQWNHDIFINPNTRSSSSETSSFNHDINHSFVANCGTTNNMDISGGYRSILPMQYGDSSRGRMVSLSIHDQRTAHGVNPSYMAMDLAITQDSRLQRVESAVRAMRPTALSLVHRNNGRYGRTSRSNRVLSFLDEDASRISQMAEGVAVMDHSAFYHPMHFIDQHRGMRLDIDNMSYEELLALEERIGYVSVGLSVDAIRSCLRETLFCSDQTEDDHEEDGCPICLEEYKDRETLGQLNCKHIFHSSCVKKWLLIKNICPICKASALEDASKEK
ncbi:probable E3 ubiquitin-protein ligase HIP1 isoform X1 [Zingiber officinale]|uniref:probable E3 ubiquitin-protein ligase HIP1 isoform X1 n=2 Tax=Zingiber officinale TaxID=94328 RepID=UPI001C4D2538|nr:probable E3 ubiquitin-protein ligase HIP1 isoform X1 [Zingiber officinale]XP_042417286.1 probable E3 ubiquitin-protein ligase HIP1 isoform X1 [Zingiber officinale]